MATLQASLFFFPPKHFHPLRPSRLPPIRFRRRLVSLCLQNPSQDPILKGAGPFNEPVIDKMPEKEDTVEASKSQIVVEEGRGFGRLGFIVFMVGIWERIKRGIFDRWGFWRQEKRLESLIAEADANPKDPVKQSALLAELNKHSPQSVIKRFEQRCHSVGSNGVAEYLKALVVTNALAEYLPDERTGKPSSLPMLLQELKQRASENEEEPFLNPGISEKLPLHVVMVDPKASNRSSRFAQELFSTILFTVVIGLM